MIYRVFAAATLCQAVTLTFEVDPLALNVCTLHRMSHDQSLYTI